MYRTITVLGCMVIAAMLITCLGCHRPSAAPGNVRLAAQTDTASSTARVQVTKPTRKTLHLETVQPGWIEAFEQAPLVAKLAGYVEKIHADIGDRVEKGKPLAELKIPELVEEGRQKEAQVEQAKASIVQAAAALRSAEASKSTAQARIREAEAGGIRARGNFEKAKAEHSRLTELANSGSISRRLVDEALDALRAAEASMAEVEAKAESARAALAEAAAAIEQAKADQQVAQARLQAAEADLSRTKALLQYTTITMPFTGVVTERNVDRGHFVQPAGAAGAKPLFVVARLDTVRVFADVPETYASMVDPGDKAEIRVQALSDRKIEGSVTRTSWALNANRTLRAELDLPNADGRLRPGMYATARIVAAERADVLSLPQTAVVRNGEQAFCCLVDQGKIKRMPIVLGLQTPEDVEVLSGLNGEEMVVAQRAESLQEGQSVEVDTGESK